MRARRRGFTLIELAVGIALGVIVLGTITSVLVFALSSQRRQKVIAELARDAQFTSQLLTSELKLAGLGVPPGEHVQEDCDAAGICAFAYGSGLRPVVFPARRVLVAGTDELAIIGDLPRPEGNFSTFGHIHNRITGSNRNIIAWHNENNGTCVPNSGNDCSTGTASLFFPGDTACTTGAPNARTCPWGLRRANPAERIQVVDGAGNWAHAAVAAGISAVTQGPANIVGLQLGLAFDLGAPSLNNDVNDATWPNTNPGDGPGGIIGQGWVTTLDRVFYDFDLANGRITRTQCVGDPDPNNANFPVHTSNTIPATLTYTPPVSNGAQSAATTCFPTEVIARNVQAVAFTYFSAAGAAIVNPPNGATKDQIARVAWNITFSAPVPAGPPATFTAAGSVPLAN